MLIVSHPIRWAVAITLAALLIFGAAVYLGRAQAVAVQDTPNPHWDKNACNQCHVVRDNKTLPIAPQKVDALCIRCHNGRAASAEAHPIGRPIGKDHPAPPPNFPLLDSKITCLTCHDIKQGCKADIERPTDFASTMLREVKVGEVTKSICQGCHTPQQFPRNNPHLMLTADRKPIEERCLTCHTETPDASIKERTGDAKLRASQLLVCRSCHPHHKEPFNPGHVGQKIKPEVLALMRARELIGLAGPPSTELVAQMTKENAQPTLMLPAPDGTIVCTTCHNPHQAGLFAAGTSLAYRGMRILDTKTVSPVRGEQWCNHCHNMN